MAKVPNLRRKVNKSNNINTRMSEFIQESTGILY